MKSQSSSQSSSSSDTAPPGGWCRGLEADISDVEDERPAAGLPRGDQIFHHLALPIHGDATPAGQRGHVDPVPRAFECEVNPVVAQALAVEAIGHPHLVQQVDRALFEHAGADPLDHVVAIVTLDDDRIDPVQMEQVPEDQAGGTRADDGHLGARALHAA